MRQHGGRLLWLGGVISAGVSLRKLRPCARVFPDFIPEGSMSSESENPTVNYNPFPPGQSSRSMVIEVDVEEFGMTDRKTMRLLRPPGGNQ